MADSDINVHVQKRIAIDIIANVIVRVYIALTVIVKIVRILLQKITFQIDIKKYLRQNQKLLLVLVQKVVVIKNIVNVIKTVQNATLLVDA